MVFVIVNCFLLIRVLLGFKDCVVSRLFYDFFVKFIIFEFLLRVKAEKQKFLIMFYINRNSYTPN